MPQSLRALLTRLLDIISPPHFACISLSPSFSHDSIPPTGEAAPIYSIRTYPKPLTSIAFCPAVVASRAGAYSQECDCVTAVPPIGDWCRCSRRGGCQPDLCHSGLVVLSVPAGGSMEPQRHDCGVAATLPETRPKSRHSVESNHFAVYPPLPSPSSTPPFFWGVEVVWGWGAASDLCPGMPPPNPFPPFSHCIHRWCGLQAP